MAQRSRQVAAGATLVVAAYLIVIPFALSLFSRTRDAEVTSDYYRDVMSDKGVSQFRANLAIVNAAGNELYGKFLPEVRGQLGLNEAQFDTLVQQNYPHVDAFLKRAPEVVKYLNPATQKVLAQKQNFHDADQFPVANVPVTVGPWSLLFLGLVLVAVGLFIWTTSARLPVLATLVVGFGLVIGPMGLHWFHETEAAEHVAEAARFPFSAPVAKTTLDDTYKFDAAFKELRLAMFPAVGRQLHKTPAEMDTDLHANYPATMKFLDAWDASIYQGAVELSLSQTRFIDEFHNADATPYRALPWLFVAPGAVLLVAGAFGLRRPGEAGASAMT